MGVGVGGCVGGQHHRHWPCSACCTLISSRHPPLLCLFAHAVGQSGASCCCCQLLWCSWTRCSSWSAGGESPWPSCERFLPSCLAYCLDTLAAALGCLLASERVSGGGGGEPCILLWKGWRACSAGSHTAIAPMAPSAASWRPQRRGQQPAVSCLDGCPPGCGAAAVR